MKTLTWCALAVLWLGACAPRAPSYPPHYEFGFMQACQGQGRSESRCLCTWEKIEANVSRRDFDAFERMTAEERAASPLQSQLEVYARECAAPPTPAAAPG